MGKIALYSCLIDCLISLVYIFVNKDYRHVDWTSFTAQGDAILDGVYDYAYIRGPKGPIAYPAGHAYLYALLNYLGISASFLYSQILWAVLHILFTFVQVSIIEQALPKKRLQILCAAMYLLQVRERLFCINYLQNDFIMMLFMTLSVYVLLKNQTLLSMIFFNLALSIKAGVVLWLPGYLLVLSMKRSILCPIFFVTFSGAFQYLFAWPFIQTNMNSYFKACLGLGRRLPQENTLLYYELPESLFKSENFAKGALVTMLSMNVLFLVLVWTNWRKFFREIRLYPISLSMGTITACQTVKIIYTSVLIQSIFTYQNHPQFVHWYSPIYPFLITICQIPLALKLPMLIIVEHGLIEQEFMILKRATAVIHVFLLYFMWKGKTKDANKIKSE